MGGSTIRGTVLTFLVPAVLSATSATATVINFDADAWGEPIFLGQVIDYEYFIWGVTIGVDNAVAGHPDLGIAFDSADPTGGDFDLRTPGTLGNARAESFSNVLIIAENDTDTDEGFVDVPDDEGARPAGVIRFAFDPGITSLGFALIDVEGPEELRKDGAITGFLELFQGGVSSTLPFENFVTYSMPFYDPTVAYGDNSVNRIQPMPASHFEWEFFDQAWFHMGGSGALGEVEFTRIPEPGTVLLLGAGLVCLGIWRRWKKSARLPSFLQ